MSAPICIDLYAGNNVSDDPTPLAGFDKVAAAGIPFIIHKASEGTGYADPRYAPRREAWMSGTPITLGQIQFQRFWGAYHFFHGASEVSAMQEAKFFLSVAKVGIGDMACLDWENVGASGYAPSALFADAFAKTVEDALGRACWVYGGNVPRENLAKVPADMAERFAKRPLWFCQYGAYNAALLPDPWANSAPLLWQDDGDRYGPGPHVIPGIDGYCDNSTVVGDVTALTVAGAW